MVLTLMVLAYNRVPLLVAMAIMVAVTVSGPNCATCSTCRAGFAAPTALSVTLLGFAIKPLRRLLISNRL